RTDRHALLLAARKRVRTLAGPLREAHLAQEAVCLASGLRQVEPEEAELESHRVPAAEVGREGPHVVLVEEPEIRRPEGGQLAAAEAAELTAEDADASRGE